jgi:hypothetical protein
MSSGAEDGASGAVVGPGALFRERVWGQAASDSHTATASRITRGHHTQNQDPCGGRLLWEVRRRFGGAEGASSSLRHRAS